MEFTYRFISLFSEILLLGAPLLISLLVWIMALGLMVGHIEGWRKTDALYWSMVTATTLGYGDMVPVRGASRLLAVIITLSGMILTGILVAIALQAAGGSIDPALLSGFKRS